jgi:hypothetical protein
MPSKAQSHQSELLDEQPITLGTISLGPHVRANSPPIARLASALIELGCRGYDPYLVNR